VTEDVAHRRAEVEALLHKTNEEDRRLLEMQALIQAKEQSRRRTSAELLWLEPEMCQRTDIAQLADLPEEEVEKLRSLEWEQEELPEERKSVAVRSSP
jgi:hypothetical protein